MSRFVAVMQDGMRVLIDADAQEDTIIHSKPLEARHVFASALLGLDEQGTPCTIRGDFVMRVYRAEDFPATPANLAWAEAVPA